MPLTRWSSSIVIAELAEEPLLSEDLDVLLRDIVEAGDAPHTAFDVIVDMQGVSRIASTNIAQLLRLRQFINERNRRLRICSVNDRVWSVLLLSRIEGLFEFTPDVSTALASLQIADA